MKSWLTMCGKYRNSRCEWHSPSYLTFFSVHMVLICTCSNSFFSHLKAFEWAVRVQIDHPSWWNNWHSVSLRVDETSVCQWRSLYYRHACRACGKVGEFFVRKTLNGNFQFLLCGGCIRLPDVRDRLVQYSIDLYGVTGKLLVPSINVSRSANT